MSKTLFLLRHAKAENTVVGEGDHSRVLNVRGQAAAVRMGQELAMLHPHEAPMPVLCSDAVRTKQTYTALCEGYGHTLPVSYHNELYLASQGDLLDFLNHEIDDDVSSALLIGHNPGFHLLAMTLVGHGDSGLRESLQEKYPTATLSCLTFNTEHWCYVTPQRGTLLHYIRPESLGVTQD